MQLLRRKDSHGNSDNSNSIVADSNKLTTTTNNPQITIWVSLQLKEEVKAEVMAEEVNLEEATTTPARLPPSKEDFAQPLENMSSTTGRKDLQIR